jgi:hypothetical protein
VGLFPPARVTNRARPDDRPFVARVPLKVLVHRPTCGRLNKQRTGGFLRGVLRSRYADIEHDQGVHDGG